jgi:hypothetical protein
MYGSGGGGGGGGDNDYAARKSSDVSSYKTLHNIKNPEGILF